MAVQTIRGQVYKILRDEICGGKYAPGTWLQEQELAERIGVSRSPVREALKTLVGDGLLIEVPNKGVFTKTFTDRDIDEIFDMRLMLETYAIHRCASRLTSARIQGLFDILEKLEQTCAARDLESYTVFDEELHRFLVDMSENSLVISTYDRVRSMNQQFRVLSLSSKRRFEESLIEHRQIVHSLAVGDFKVAERVLRTHLELACSTIKEQIS